MNAERHLCSDYNKYIRFIPESVFQNYIEFLRRANDIGRSPTPWWAVLLLAVLVIAEALGFSYLLGGMIAMDGSANTRNLLMYAIVTVICIITLVLTHAAGHQYYRTSLLRACFKRFKESGGRGRFFSGKIALSDDQTKDDDQPDHTQCANRVCENPSDQGSYGIIVVAAIFILAIAVGSTWMRWENLRKSMTEETVNVKLEITNPFSNGGLALPPAVTAPQKEAEQKAKDEMAEATKSGSLAGFLMLAFIFIVTQLVGIGVGFRYGFASKQSKDAFQQTRGFATYEAYLLHYQAYIDLATARLYQLQQRMEKLALEKLDLHKTFRDFILESAQESARLRHGMNRTATDSSGLGASVGSERPPVLDEQIVAQLAKLDRLNDKAAKAAHLQALEMIDEALYRAVIARLRLRKSEQEQRHQSPPLQAGEIDSLLS